MKLPVLLGLVLFTTAVPAAPWSNKSNLNRESGAVYLEDLGKSGIRVRIQDTVTAYSDLTGQRPLGNVLAGQTAELVAYSPRAVRVRAQAAQGGIVGWIAARAIVEPQPGFFEKLTALAERQKQVAELIAKKEVAIGMTPDEVRAALGKPEEQTSKLERAGSTMTWGYITYDRVPQYTWGRDVFGRAVRQLTYLKVETGRFSVIFENNAVASIESTKGPPGPNSRVKIVVPPIIVW
jgi:hypothetical protein